MNVPTVLQRRPINWHWLMWVFGNGVTFGVTITLVTHFISFPTSIFFTVPSIAFLIGAIQIPLLGSKFRYPGEWFMSTTLGVIFGYYVGGFLALIFFTLGRGVLSGLSEIPPISILGSLILGGIAGGTIGIISIRFLERFIGRSISWEMDFFPIVLGWALAGGCFIAIHFSFDLYLSLGEANSIGPAAIVSGLVYGLASFKSVKSLQVELPTPPQLLTLLLASRTLNSHC